MKRTLLIIMMLFGLAALTEAQIVVTSTTASTKHVKKERPKSGREKGLVIRPEFEYGSGFAGYGNIGINAFVGYQFNPYFAVGGSCGFLLDIYYKGPNSHHSNSEYTFINEQRPSSIPLYANARVYFIDRKWSPFLDLKLGYLIPIRDGKYSYEKTYYYSGTIGHGKVTETMLGFTFGGTLGVQFKGFDLGITAQSLKIHHVDNYDQHSYVVDENQHLGYFGISIAYNIQFK